MYGDIHFLCKFQFEIDGISPLKVGVLNGHRGNQYGVDGVSALDDGVGMYVGELDHLVHQFRDALGVGFDACVDVGTFLFAKLNAGGGQYLCETAQNIQRRSYLG